MIYAVPKHKRASLAPLFQGMTDTCILSCLQGHMGEAWVDHLDDPKVAQIIVGDFAFFVGDASIPEAKALLQHIPETIFAIVETEEWKQLIGAVYGRHAVKLERYAFRKSSADLHIPHVRTFLQGLPEGYEVKKMDADLAASPSLQAISPDFTGQFESISDFIARGIGYVVMFDKKVVCAASSYSIYDEGIEIEIGTAPEHRRKGLASAVAAALIIDCLERGLYPSWDAANQQSARLATRLGYVMAEAYDAYELHRLKK